MEWKNRGKKESSTEKGDSIRGLRSILRSHFQRELNRPPLMHKCFFPQKNWGNTHLPTAQKQPATEAGSRTARLEKRV